MKTFFTILGIAVVVFGIINVTVSLFSLNEGKLALGILQIVIGAFSAMIFISNNQ